MGSTWKDCEGPARTEVAARCSGYRFQNALQAVANYWLDVVNGDHSKPEKYAQTVHGFMACLELTGKLWNESARKYWPTDRRVTIGNRTANSIAVAAMEYFVDVARVLSDGPMSDANTYGDNEVTSEQLKRFKQSMVEHFSELGIPAKPGDARGIIDQIELMLPAETKAAETDFSRRWKELHARFLRANTPDMLTAAMVQGGSIIADMVTAGRIPRDDVLNGFIETAEQHRYRNLHLAEFSLHALFVHYAMRCSSDPNTAALQVVHSSDGVQLLQSKPNSHLERAERYAAFCSELADSLGKPAAASVTEPAVRVSHTPPNENAVLIKTIADFARLHLAFESNQQQLVNAMLDGELTIEVLKAKFCGINETASKNFSELWKTVSKKMKSKIQVSIEKDGKNQLKFQPEHNPNIART